MSSSTNDKKPSYMTQEYFDEVLRENEDLLELGPDAAVAETLQQLAMQQPKSSFRHLSWKHPDTEEGRREREDRQLVQDALEALKEEDISDTAKEPVCTTDHLQNVGYLVGLEDSPASKYIRDLIDYYVIEYITEEELKELRKREEEEKKAGPNVDMLQQWFLVLEGPSVFTRVWIEAQRNHEPRVVENVVQLLSRSEYWYIPTSSLTSTESVPQARFQIPSSTESVSAWMATYATLLHNWLSKELQWSIWVESVFELLAIGQAAVAAGNKEETAETHNENKQTWMTTTKFTILDDTVTPTELSVPVLLMQTMEQIQLGEKSRKSAIMTKETCRFITSLCKVRDESDPTLTTLSHAAVHAFCELGAVSALVALLTQQRPEPREASASAPALKMNNVTSTASILTALRCCAIQDVWVQSMVAGGLLHLLSGLLRDLCQETVAGEGKTLSTTQSKHRDELLELSTATMGLIRNLCANDEIKGTICRGGGADSEYESMTSGIIELSNFYLKHGTEESTYALHEHVCGIVAAMALRSIPNVCCLIGNRVAPMLVGIMKLHPTRVTVQRQAALAIRNLVSRVSLALSEQGNDESSEDGDGTTTVSQIRPALLEAGVESALRNIAGKHVACQDEVYAALRDLGLTATRMQAVKVVVAPENEALGGSSKSDINGKVFLVAAERETFGERNSNFRPIYD